MRALLGLAIVWTCLAGGRALGADLLAPTAAGQAASVLVLGQPAPALTAPTPAGHIVTLHDYRGRPVILNFWATWCLPCRQEMAALQAVYEAHQAKGLMILAVSQDDAAHASTIPVYWTTLGLTFLPLLDPDGAIATPYKVVFLPSTVFVHPAGTLAAIHIGPMNQSQIEQHLRTILPQPE